MGSGLIGGADGEDPPVALVAESSATERKALAQALSEIGYGVLCVATPLEMVHHLEYGRGRIALIILGTSLGHYEGEELASFVAEAYPQLRRVSLTRRPGEGRALPEAAWGGPIEQAWTADLIRSALGSDLGDGDAARAVDGGD